MQMPGLNFHSFFSHYLTDPLSPNLSWKEKIITVLATASLTLLTLGLIFPLTSNLRNRVSEQPANLETVQKINVQFGKHLNQKNQAPCVSPLLASIEHAFTQKLNAYATHYPKDYREGSIPAILQALKQAMDKQAFFKEIDRIKNEGLIVGKSAYNMKQLVDKLIQYVPVQPVSSSSFSAPAWNASLLVDQKIGVVEKADKYPNISEKHRYQVRDTTKESLTKAFNVDHFGDLTAIEHVPNNFSPYLKKVTLFTTQGDDNKYQTQKTQLLGSFDVLAVPCKMDYDSSWNPIKAKSKFFLHNGAALNIGESSRAPDFKDYTIMGKNELDEQKYIAGMGKIFYQMLAAQEKSGATDAVWFPFGMGAFLRHLPKVDANYNDPERFNQLRQKIAQAFVDQVAQFPGLQIHMCLPTDQAGTASCQNHNAFMYAFSKAPEKVRKNIKVYINIDATDLAQRLADQKEDYKVSLANGANRNLIGNHWFEDRALVAIDENIHRRSTLAAGLALIFNNGIQNKSRQPDALANRVLELHGSYTKI
jgi:hypothetical protein